MITSLNKGNKNYWQKYKPGQIPFVPQDPPNELLKNVKTVLDVGTGDGVLAEKLAQQGLEVYGIDIAENIIEENRKRRTNVKYSIQNITEGTNFTGSFFDLIIFRFTLTNIHKESWKNVGREVNRILKPQGKVWILEPLVSEGYKNRYELASNFLKDDHCVYVFFDKDLAEKIKTKKELENAQKDGKVSRIVKHYEVKELKEIFDQFVLESSRVIKVKSPSGFLINTFEGIFSR